MNNLTICIVDNCGNPVLALKMCGKHYKRYSTQHETRQCSLPDCTSPLAWKGYCRKHYQRWLTHGTPNKIPWAKTQQEHIERFWSKVDRSNGADACWIWQCTLRSGYGRFSMGSMRHISAHKFAWELANGRKVRDGLVMRHTCDVKACVNPSHLLEGTQAENMRDARQRGLVKIGEGSSNAGLSNEDVIEIRRRYIAGEKQTDIAKDYGYHASHVSRIVNRHAWTHI